MSHTTRWTIEKITQRMALIEPLVYCRRIELPPFRFLPLAGPEIDPPVGMDIDDGEWELVRENTYWGKPGLDFILRTTFQAPAEWKEAGPLALYLPIGDAENFSHPEALAYLDGSPYAGVDRHHREIVLPKQFLDGESHLLALHGWTGLGVNWRTDTPTGLVMGACSLVQIDTGMREFIIAARVALDTAQALDGNSPERVGLLNALDRAFRILDTRDPLGESFYASVPHAYKALQDGIAHAGEPMRVKLSATGHAHIDVAWLWTLGQTRRKAGRSFHTVLRLMERYPDFHFTQSQPQLYDYVRRDYPELFEAIKRRVAEGRWEPVGGMWVEADCNLSGAEALARQFLLGRRFFREHFGEGAESEILWLPDVFGYAWALPQLIKQAGLEYFFTIKLGWSQYNRIPYDSFWWQGLDGTRVLTHFSTTTDYDEASASTYNALARPGDALRTWKHFQQKELQNEVLMAFGYGDGGGGPTSEMVENLVLMKDFPGLPRARQRGAGQFFRDLERNSGEQLPVWDGELYLEYHRGTYTSQSRNKRANRKSEFSIHDAEFLACLAAYLDTSYAYPAEALGDAWKLICLNQFHDIIPGSSIGAVYTQSLEQYADVERNLAEIKQSALDVIANKVGGDLLLINPTGFARRDQAWWQGELPEGVGLLRPDGTPVEIQREGDGAWIDAGDIPPYSVMPLCFSDSVWTESTPGLSAAPDHLENGRLRIEFNPDGDITRIYDKVQERDVLAPGRTGNEFQAFEDRPMFWDAWDIDIYYEDMVWGAEPARSIRVVACGPLRATLEIERMILNSSYTQRITLQRDSVRIDFDTTIDWQERHMLLKAAFPVEILAPTATYEIQWGNVQRATHRNTSWDWARFETCAHKWVDISEGGYGVSLLNDCKYGHDIHENVIRLSLLRGPTVPDPEADRGEHHFTYSLLPHADGWQGETQAEAYALNDPLIVFAGSRNNEMSELGSFVKCNAENIIIETVKQAEDGRGFIVRFYESQRVRGPVRLSAAFQLALVERTNLLEEPQETLQPQDRHVALYVKPYEIVTLRMIPV